MSGCAKLPLELVLSTNDPELYSVDSGEWTWAGELYWAVECLPDNQRSVADNSVPQLGSFVEITDVPTFWDFCSSGKCLNTSRNFLVAFTFNPNSDDPNDYLQYVIDGSRITDRPRHSIKDSDDKNLYIVFEDLEKSANRPYLELWIRRASGPDSAINVLNTSNDNGGESKGLRVVLLILAVLAGIAAISGLLWFGFSRFNRPKRLLGPPM